jgi:hypothetical protein
MQCIRVLCHEITIIPIRQIFPNGLIPPLLILLKPLVTASLTNSLTALNGRNTRLSPPFMPLYLYSNARVLTACVTTLA